MLIGQRLSTPLGQELDADNAMVVLPGRASDAIEIEGESIANRVNAILGKSRYLGNSLVNFVPVRRDGEVERPEVSMDLKVPISDEDREGIWRGRGMSTKKPFSVRHGDRYRVCEDDVLLARFLKPHVQCVQGAISPALTVRDFNRAGYGFELDRRLFKLLHDPCFQDGLPEDMVALMRGEHEAGGTLDQLVENEIVRKAVIPVAGYGKKDILNMSEEALAKVRDAVMSRSHADCQDVPAFLRFVVDDEAQPLSSYAFLKKWWGTRLGFPRIFGGLGALPQARVDIVGHPGREKNVLWDIPLGCRRPDDMRYVVKVDKMEEVLSRNEGRRIAVEMLMFDGEVI